MRSIKDSYTIQVRYQTQYNFKSSKKSIKLSILILFMIIIIGLVLEAAMPQIKFTTNKIKTITTQVDKIKEKSTIQAIFENFTSGIYF